MNNYEADNIFVVIVCFNGFPEIEHTVNALYNKVGHIHIVDNKSDAATQSFIRVIEEKKDITITWLQENKGIGCALNIGANVADSFGYKWLLTMDQDSIVDKNMINEYCKSIKNNPNLVCLTPNIIVHGKENKIISDDFVKYAITSGNLVKISLLKEIGLYNEDLFIDCIDFDFSLRVRQAGHSIFRVKAAIMQHELGEDFKLPILLSKYYTLHSPLRRYYMYRNSMFIMDKYISTFPVFVLKLIITNLILLVLIIFYDKKPCANLSYIYKGIKDYFSGIKGMHKEND